MSKFVSCIECGNRISSEAESCPKCSVYFRNCISCGKVLRKLEPNSGIHQKCLDQIKLESNVVCKLCGKSHNYEEMDKQGGPDGYGICINCGEPLRFKICAQCKFPIPKNEELKVTSPNSMFGGEYVSFIHRRCKGGVRLTKETKIMEPGCLLLFVLVVAITFIAVFMKF